MCRQINKQITRRREDNFSAFNAKPRNDPIKPSVPAEQDAVDGWGEQQCALPLKHTSSCTENSALPFPPS